MKFLSLLIILAITNFTSVYAKILYVDSTAAGNNTGINWTDAYTTLSAALEEANINTAVADSIFIAAGTYYPTGMQTSTDRDSAFCIYRGGIKLYGGYPAGGGVRNIDSNIVILDGGIGSNTASDNSYHVMVIAGIGSDADSIVVDGITMKSALANANTVRILNGVQLKRSYGGGLAIIGVFNGGKTSIRFCNVRDNRVQATWIPTPPMGGHSDEGAGAGIYVWKASPYIYNCMLTNNFAAASAGGGLFLTQDTTIVDRCVLKDNKAESSGAAVECSIFSKAHIINCIASGNSSYEAQVLASVIGSTKNNNTRPIIKGCLIYGNDGSAIELLTCSIINCTVTGNLIGYSDHTLIPASGGPAYISNSIFTGNQFENIEVSENDVEVNFCLVGGGYPGNGNINASPMFENAAGANYRLQAISPAINAGNNSYVMDADMSLDLAGNPRIVDSIVDMGAYEYPETIPPTNVEDINDENIIVMYPNPVASMLNIKSNGHVQAVIYSTDGKICFWKEHASTLDLSFLLPGIYQIKLYDTNEKLLKTQRFVKMP